MRQGRGKQTDPDVRDAILALHAQGWSTSRLMATLDQDPAFAGRVPAERTVRHITRGRVAQPEDRWSFTASPAADAAILLPTLAALPGIPWVNADVGRWMIRIRQALPGVEPLTALMLAARYALAERTGGDTGPLDEELVRLSGAGAR